MKNTYNHLGFGRISAMMLLALLIPVQTTAQEGEGEPPSLEVLACDRILLSEPIAFETGTDQLTSASQTLLDRLAELLAEDPTIGVLQVGAHTDSQGSSAYNQSTSLQRANVVVSYLVSAGVSPERVRGHGFGEERPIASNATAEGRAQNRRVEFVIIEQDECPVPDGETP